ncbi:DUF397 domain-containing protein [Streptomyces soliscabiei]|uniref:DUF397 domain-containing protein n=1 Tax=Streptomyces soliscabiei TaxID=588897 RepID=UPI0029A1454F|nr:DUF397 domain-containing protein [Streptomyces sp. NY05-11A]MDX2679935.1 DUF397 domain-containing protein [Streptomyces sp. NY05-11A]
MIRKASAGDSELVWFKSSYSDSSNPNDCVEVANTPDTIHVRDSKHAAGPRLQLSSEAWANFVPYVSQG